MACVWWDNGVYDPLVMFGYEIKKVEAIFKTRKTITVG